jgi:hypothetical protein
MTDSNKNITRKFDLNRKKMELKIDFDSSKTCYNLDPKKVSATNKRNFDENSILLILNKDRAASFIHFG